MGLQIMQQQPHTPSYPDILWNKPLNRQGAGKLLIVGGNKFRFFAPAQAQVVAEKNGAGIVKVLMPDAVKKYVGTSEYNEFAPTNKSGSFAKSALDTLLSLAQWSDTVLLAGDASHNSETSLLSEKFLESYKGQVVVTQDFLDMHVSHPEPLLQRENTLLVASFSQLQKIASNSGFSEPFTFGMSLTMFLEQLGSFVGQDSCSAHIITLHQQHLVVATKGNVAYMKTSKDVWRVEQAAKSAVLWMQQPDTPFESLTTSLLDEKVMEATS